jgi:hypothetical protein
MQKWDYGVHTISLEPGVPHGLDLFTGNEDLILSCALEQWGEKGWELVSIIPVSSTHIRAVFKRLQAPEETPEERKERVERERLKRRARGRLSS